MHQCTPKILYEHIIDEDMAQVEWEYDITFNGAHARAREKYFIFIQYRFHVDTCMCLKCVYAKKKERKNAEELYTQTLILLSWSVFFCICVSTFFLLLFSSHKLWAFLCRIARRLPYAYMNQNINNKKYNQN